MADRLVAEKTPATVQEIFTALWRAWVQIFGTTPRVESILILLAQWAFETGYGKAMRCFNFGNVKSTPTDGFDYCYFACNEILTKAQALAYVAKNPETAKITKVRDDGKVVIWFYPDHPGCRFRAFHSIFEGAIDHLSIVSKKFSKSWPAVLAGDPKQYAHMLKMQKYYTGDESVYTSSLVSIFHGLVKRNMVVEPEEVKPVDLNQITDMEKQRIAALVSLTMQQSYEENTRFTRILNDEDS
jgi:hypothetical protein